MSMASIALNRFGLGGRPGERPPADPRGWLLSQVGGSVPLPAELRDTMSSQDFIRMASERAMARREARGMDGGKEVDAKNDARQETLDVASSQIQARILAATRTETPFRERLVHFWANHFALSTDKVTIVGMPGIHEVEAIRPNVTGKFADMVLAASLHPAMQIYLDQPSSVGPDSRFAGFHGEKVGLNENLAREIMELHTLGVSGGYSQADVRELAMALTGWTLEGFRRTPDAKLVFDPKRHQPGSRTIMGNTYAAGDKAQGRAILSALAMHPSTARHIATKLARHFAADDPPASLVAKLEKAFLDSGGDLPTVYRALVMADEPWRQTYTKFRTPWDWLIAAERAAPDRPDDKAIRPGLLTQLGQTVWQPGSPAGWGDTQADWAVPDALFKRVEIAPRLAQRTGRLDIRQSMQNLFPDAMSETTARVLDGAESAEQAFALLLSSPEMMRR